MVPIAGGISGPVFFFSENQEINLGNESGKLTSGGIAIDHIATPAVPPATMMAPRFNSAGDEPAGVKAFLVISYAAKYLLRVVQYGTRRRKRCNGIRCTSWTISNQGSPCSTENASHPALFVKMLQNVGDSLIFVFRASLPLNLRIKGYRVFIKVFNIQSPQHTCKRTFALSTGAVTIVVGTADKNPARANSGIDSASFALFGVAA